MIKSIVVIMVVVVTSSFAGHLEDERITIAVEKMEYIPGPSEFKNVENIGRMISAMLTSGCANRVADFDFISKEDLDKIVQEQIATVQYGGRGARPGKIKGSFFKILGEYSIIGSKIKVAIRFINCETGLLDGSKSFIISGLCDPPEELEQVMEKVYLSMMNAFTVPLSDEERRIIKKEVRIGRASREYLLNAADDFEKGNLDDAIHQAESSIKSNPNVTDAYILQGIIFIEQQKYDQALISLNQAIDIDSDDPCALYNRGRYFYKVNQFAEARADLERAVEIKPFYVDAYCALGVLYWQGFEDASYLAENNFKIALHLTNDTHRNTLLFYSQFLIEKRRFKEAEKMLETYKRVWGDTAVYNNLADALLRQCQ
jgi:Tfp pilus assembly protein PilF